MHIKLRSITQLLKLPSICSLCNHYHNNGIAVCNACVNLLKPLGVVCQYCALPLPESNFIICGQCLKQKPHFDKVITAYRFEEPLRALLHEFKYQQGLYLRSFLAELMLKAITPTDLKTQCLIPVPLHPKRLRERGFNQAAELTKYLASAINRPYSLFMSSKTKHTSSQTRLSAASRQYNLRNAFRVQPTHYQHITLVDDLLTTGSTANSLASLFKKAGVNRVDVWCCARVSLD